MKRWENTAVHPLVVGDAEPLPWPTPNNGGGDGGVGEIQGCCLFERLLLLLVTLNLCLGQHRTTAAVMVTAEKYKDVGLFECVQLLLVTLNLCLGQHRTTAAVMVAGNCITTPTGLNNNSHRCNLW
ncbi:MAG: hypothetical protein NTW54_03295 [Bacteroidetes bacterium]|nr:hypothetical protein [Bacteroidota bacterium]